VVLCAVIASKSLSETLLCRYARPSGVAKKRRSIQYVQGLEFRNRPTKICFVVGVPVRGCKSLRNRVHWQPRLVCQITAPCGCTCTKNCALRSRLHACSNTGALWRGREPIGNIGDRILDETLLLERDQSAGPLCRLPIRCAPQ
jgi:hypothetical protein